MGRGPKVSEAEKSQILVMKQSGMSVPTIASKLKRSMGLIYQTLKAFEVTAVPSTVAATHTRHQQHEQAQQGIDPEHSSRIARSQPHATDVQVATFAPPPTLSVSTTSAAAHDGPDIAAVSVPAPTAASSMSTVGRGPAIAKVAITRPPKVIPISRVHLMQKGENAVANFRMNCESQSKKLNQRPSARKDTIASPDAELMQLIMGMAPEDDVKYGESTQPSQPEAEESSSKRQHGSSPIPLTNAKTPSLVTSVMSSLATPTAQHSSDAVSISKTSFLNAPRPSQQPTCSGQVVDESREIDICCHPLAKKNKTDSVKAAPNTIQPDEDLLTASEDATAKNDSVDSFFSVMHAEIKKLQRGDAHDCSAKLYQLLLKFQSEARLLNLSTASNISELKRKRQDSTDGLPLDLLLHEKAVSEIALLKLQAERVQAQLDRERMKTKVEAVLSKKKLEDASTPESTVNWIISQRMLGRPW